MNLRKYIKKSTFIRDLRNRGFNRDYELTDDNLRCSQTGKIYPKEKLSIVEYNRFMESEETGSRIVVAVECEDGEQGIISASQYTPLGKALLMFMDKVKILPRKNPSRYE